MENPKVRAIQDIAQDLYFACQEARQTHGFDAMMSAMALIAARITHDAEHFSAAERSVPALLAREYVLGAFLTAFSTYLNAENQNCDLQRYMSQIKPQGEA